MSNASRSKSIVVAAALAARSGCAQGQVVHNILAGVTGWC
jgi:hypothetical protein